MKFRTEIDLERSKHLIGYHKPILMMGSCFTDNVGANFKKYLFDVTINPFGVTYNPFSIKNSIEILLKKEKYVPEDLHFYNELYFSYDHYTKFSDSKPGNSLEKINRSFMIARERLKTAGHLILTFGTAFIYEHKDTGKLVNNCHKQPASMFNRRMLSVEEITMSYSELIKELCATNPELKILFTLSPVRHIKDGFTENLHSKSTLLLAIKKLQKNFPETCTYFPAYEIMMDDLRDYRFYAEDMLHPNDQAIAYIWNLFKQAQFEDEVKQILSELDPLLKARQHRPLHTETESYKKFQVHTEEKIRKLKSIYPFLKWSDL